MLRLNNYSARVFMVLMVCCCSCLLSSTNAQSSTVRPYKFGFTIDEQQHRSEQRDEKGIVMGEFGFITADGIYHVTVYATDEQGRFRILAMKNYPYESPPKTVEIMVEPKVAPTTTTTTTVRPKIEIPRQNFYQEACSGCFLSEGDREAKLNGETPKSGIRTLSKVLPNPPSPKATNAVAKPKSPAGKPTTGFNKPATPTIKPKIFTNTNTAATTAIRKVVAKPKPTQTKALGTKPQGQQTPAVKTPSLQGGLMDMIVNKVLPAVMGTKGVVAKTPTINNAPSGKTPPKSFTPTGSAGSNAVAVSKPGNSNFNPKSPASAVGGDGDLYRFKYILDYHGHTETGKSNGNKEGNYYAIGDDDVERTITYVANENGYQPRISWRRLPKKESRPQENTLKEYEFVWFNKN